MRLSNNDIKKFIDIHRQVSGDNLGIDEARSIAENLLSLAELLASSCPQFEFDSNGEWRDDIGRDT